MEQLRLERLGKAALRMVRRRRKTRVQWHLRRAVLLHSPRTALALHSLHKADMRTALES